MNILGKFNRAKKILLRYWQERQTDLIFEPDWNVSPDASKIDKSLRKAMRKFRVPGMAAVLFNQTEILWSSALGYADMVEKRLMTCETVFRVASISKMIVATAIMQLYEQERLDLEEDISRLLGFEVRNPHCPNCPITVSHLMTHTSTLLDEAIYLDIADNRPGLMCELDIKEFLLPGGLFYTPNTYADCLPGEEFNYSNLAINLLGCIVENVSRMRYDRYCHDHVFAPLGIDAGFELAALRNRKNNTVLYKIPLFKKRGYIVGSAVDNTMPPVKRKINTRLGSALGYNPAGGLRINALDLAKFMMMFTNRGIYKERRVLKPSSVEIMRCVAWQGNGLGGLYKYKALGFHITDDLIPEVRMIGHSAEAYGMIGDAYYNPREGWGMVFLMNGGVTRDSEDSGFYEVEMAMADNLFRHMQNLKYRRTN